MQDKIGDIYQIVVLIMLIIGSIIAIIYRKKMYSLQKSYLSKRKDFLNQKVLESMEARSDKSSYSLIIIVALIIMLGAITQLLIIIL